MPTGHASLLPALRRVVLARDEAARTDGQLLTAFVLNRDADAFAGLVRRHGPMVLGVCRRVVGDHSVADDAFQAVFLVLARRGAAVRPREQVGNWLYGVAYRTAMKARAVLARRRSREKQVETMPEPPARSTGGSTSPGSPDSDWSDLKPVIDEELARLPEKLRLPVVLCDLEGRPQRQVAKDLGVPPATLATRIASARRLLASRLARRGVALSGGALATLLGERASAAVVCPRLADAAVRAAEAVCSGGLVSGLVSSQAVHLSDGVLRMMMLAKLKAVGATAVALLALTGGLGLGMVPAARADDPNQPSENTRGADAPRSPQPAAPKPPDDFTYLNRLCLDLRGTPATPMEHRYFAADPDPDKRRKVADWLAADEAVRAYLAKSLNVPPDRVRVLGVRPAGSGWVAELVVTAPRVTNAAVSPDGKALVTVAELLPRNTEVGLNGTVVLNETYAEAVNYTLLRRVNLNQTWAFRTTDTDPNVPPANFLADPPAAADATAYFLFYAAQPPAEPRPSGDALRLWVTVLDSDAEFLRRAVTAARGTPPSAIEERYFTEDKDPKKREKLLDLLLKDPAVAKKVGDDWKKKMLDPGPADPRVERYYLNEVAPWVPYRVVPTNPPAPPAPQPDRLEKLVGTLLAANRTDEQVSEAVTLAVVGRLPTDAEKRLALAAVSKAADRKAAWLEVAKALAGTDEAKKYAAELNRPAAPGK